MLSKSLRNQIVLDTGCLLTGIIFTFIVPTGVFGPLVIGFSIAWGLTILEKTSGN